MHNRFRIGRFKQVQCLVRRVKSPFRQDIKRRLQPFLRRRCCRFVVGHRTHKIRLKRYVFVEIACDFLQIGIRQARSVGRRRQVLLIPIRKRPLPVAVVLSAQHRPHVDIALRCNAAPRKRRRYRISRTHPRPRQDFRIHRLAQVLQS